jgi:hypothetical protein
MGASPEEKMSMPELPPDEVPESKRSPPDMPTAPAFGVTSSISPLDVSTLAPADKRTDPPVD